MKPLQPAFVVILAILFTASLILAESINPPTSPQVAPMNPQEKKNLDTVMNWWREVIYAGHLDLAPKYQAEDYVQHNPGINTGLSGFVEFFGKSGRKPMDPIPPAMPKERMPAVMGAKGDYVWLIFEHEAKDPRDSSKTYRFNTIDVMRLERGKIQEHWDGAQKMPGSGNIKTGASPKPPMEWNTGTLSTEEKKNLQIGLIEFKDMLQYAHLELADKFMDPGYIQHNPNVPQGRDGFKEYMALRGRAPEDRPIKPEWPNPPVLTLVNGPYVFFMWERTAKDPDDPNLEYKWNHFDIVRFEKGLIREHWDEAGLNSPR